MSDLEDAIDTHLSSATGVPFAVFDFDNTCIINDVGEATLAYLCGHELLRDRSLIGEEQDEADYHRRVFQTYYALIKEGQLKAAYMLIGRLFSGFTPGEAEAVTLAAIIEEGSRIGSKVLYGLHIERGLAVRRDVLALMYFLRGREVRIWIVSASAEPAVRAAMKHFGIEGDLIATKSVLNNGVFTSQLESPMPIIEGKVECMRTFIDSERAPLLAIDESPTGLSLLETATIKVVVDRNNKLTDVARERGWFLL